jgi:hypothetical protein
MNTRLIFASIGLLALTAATATLATAGDHRHGDKPGHAGPAFDEGMQVVPTTAGPGEAGHGWQYFSDPAARRAVVISPQGDYFLSRGRGLHRIAVTQPRS